MMDAHRDFVARDRRAPPRRCITPEEGTRAVEVANAVYLSAMRGESVELPLAPGAYAPVYEQLSTGARHVAEVGEARVIAGNQGNMGADLHVDDGRFLVHSTDFVSLALRVPRVGSQAVHPHAGRARRAATCSTRPRPITRTTSGSGGATAT